MVQIIVGEKLHFDLQVEVRRDKSEVMATWTTHSLSTCVYCQKSRLWNITTNSALIFFFFFYTTRSLTEALLELRPSAVTSRPHAEIKLCGESHLYSVEMPRRYKIQKADHIQTFKQSKCTQTPCKPQQSQKWPVKLEKQTKQNKTKTSVSQIGFKMYY